MTASSANKSAFPGNRRDQYIHFYEKVGPHLDQIDFGLWGALCGRSDRRLKDALYRRLGKGNPSLRFSTMTQAGDNCYLCQGIKNKDCIAEPICITCLNKLEATFEKVLPIEPDIPQALQVAIPLEPLCAICTGDVDSNWVCLSCYHAAIEKAAKSPTLTMVTLPLQPNQSAQEPAALPETSPPPRHYSFKRIIKSAKDSPPEHP